MPNGARYVSLGFSTATMRITKTRYEVKNISAKTPWAKFIPGAKVVFTDAMSPGNMTFTIAPAHMHAISCVGIKKAALTHGS